MKREDCSTLISDLLDKYGLTGWMFDFDSSVSRFGICKYSVKIISLSKKLVELNDEEIVRQVILHEIAHAMVGHKAGHGQLWKDVARSIGYKGERCYNSCEVNTPKGKYLSKCNNCGYERPAHRRKNRVACGRCCNKYNGGKWNDKYLIEYILNN